MLNEEVRKIMRTNPIVIKPDDMIQDVSKMMIKKRLQQLPVIDDENKLVGLITVYDLWRNTSKSSEQRGLSVKDVMTTDVLVISPKDKMGTAAELFIDQRFKTLPVVNLDNELKGVITAFDVIKHCYVKEYPNPILYKEKLKD
jgi:CBS domain-containing protein